VEDAGPVGVVIVGRLEQELHHPLAWQGWQSGQEVTLGQCEGVLNLENGVPVPLCLDAKVLDGTGLCRPPRARGVNLHVLKADGLGVYGAEHLFIVDEELDLCVPIFYLLRHSDLGPLVNWGGRDVYPIVRVVIERIGNDKAPPWVDKDFRVTVAKVVPVSSDCHVEDAGPVGVVIVGRLEQELHHPLVWQGRQSSQQVALGQVQFLLDLVDGIPRPD